MQGGGSKFLRHVYSRFLVDLGLSMHKKGSQMTGSKYFNENKTDHKTYYPIEGHKTTAGDNCKVAITAQLFGAIELSNNNIVGIKSVLTANSTPIRLGENTIVGNQVNILTQKIDSDTISSVNVGDNVLIEDRSILKSCQIGNNVLIGERAQIQEGAQIEDNVIIEEGTVINRLQIIPENTVWSGAPAQKVRNLTAEDKDKIQQKLNEVRQNYEAIHQTQIFDNLDQLGPLGQCFTDIEGLYYIS